jgi:YVTN family beta-propeller protein
MAARRLRDTIGRHSSRTEENSMIRSRRSRDAFIAGLALQLFLLGVATGSPSPPARQTGRSTSDTTGMMDNVHQLGMRPDGKELWMETLERHLVFINIESSDYPVAGELHLPGSSSHPISEITFSTDSRYAYLTDALQCTLEPDCASLGFGDRNRVLVIDTAVKTIVRIIPLSEPWSPTGSHAITSDGRYLFLTVTDYQHDGVYKLDLQTGQLVAFLELQGTNFLTLAPDGTRLFVTRGRNASGLAPGLFSVVDVASFQVTGSVTVGSGPWFAAISPDRAKAYVSNQFSDTVSVVDLGTMQVSATIAVGGQPKGILFTLDRKRAYVAIFRDASGNGAYGEGTIVSVINAETDAHEKDIPAGIEPSCLVMDPQGIRVFSSDGNANGLHAARAHLIDAVHAVYVKEIVARPAAFYTPTGIDVTPDGRRLFVICEARRTLVAIDAPSGAVLAGFALDPRAVKVSRSGRLLYVYSARQPSDGRGRFFVIDTESLRVLRSIDLGVITTRSIWDSIVYRIAMNSGETVAYLAGGDGDEVIVVDLVRERVVTRIWTGADGNPLGVPARGIAITPDDKKVFVSSCLAQKVSVIDTSTNSIVASVPLPDCLSEVKISLDGQRVFVQRQFSTLMMTVLDANTYAVVKHVLFPAAVHAVLDFYLSADERWLYSIGFDQNWVMVYDITEANYWGIVDTLIKTRLDPFNGALTADRRTLYVTDFSSDAVSAIDIAARQVSRTIALPPVMVIEHPSSLAVAAGSLASFTASGDGSPTPTVRWQVSGDGGTTWNDIGGATEVAYSFNASAADHGKQFRAVFANAGGTATTKPAPLSVLSAVSVSPPSGSTGGGTSVTVTGTGFVLDGTVVMVGASPATHVSVANGNRLTATTPPGPIGTAVVTVTTAAGSVSVPGGFTYFLSPFTDDPLQPGTTPIKAVHLEELRQAIQALRDRYLLPEYSWTDPHIVAKVTTIKAAHLTEMRTALAEVYTAAGLTPPGWTPVAVTRWVTVITAAQIAEIRTAVAAIW